MSRWLHWLPSLLAYADLLAVALLLLAVLLS
jgi:hypothetical protein